MSTTITEVLISKKTCKIQTCLQMFAFHILLPNNKHLDVFAYDVDPLLF